MLCIPFVIWTACIFIILFLFFPLNSSKRRGREKSGKFVQSGQSLWQTNEILTIKPPPLCRYLSALTSQFAALLWFLRVYKRESNGVVNTACKKPSNFPSLRHKPVFLLFSVNSVWGFCCILKWMCNTAEGLLFFPLPWKWQCGAFHRYLAWRSSCGFSSDVIIKNIKTLWVLSMGRFFLLGCYSLVDCTRKLEMKLLYADKSILLLSACSLWNCSTAIQFESRISWK